MLSPNGSAAAEGEPAIEVSSRAQNGGGDATIASRAPATSSPNGSAAAHVPQLEPVASSPYGDFEGDLGSVLRTLGVRENGTTKLEAAVAAFREALKESTREQAPLDWAMNQHNLGVALAILGRTRTGGQARRGHCRVSRGPEANTPASAPRSIGPLPRTIWA